MGAKRRCIVRDCKSTAEEMTFRKYFIRNGHARCPLHRCQSFDPKCGCTVSMKLFSHYLFPKDLDLRKLWIKLLNLPDNFVPSNYTSVCSRHFDIPYSTGRLGGGYKVPTLHIGRAESEIQELVNNHVAMVIEQQEIIGMSTPLGKPSYVRFGNAAASTVRSVEIADVRSMKRLHDAIDEMICEDFGDLDAAVTEPPSTSKATSESASIRQPEATGSSGSVSDMAGSTQQLVASVAAPKRSRRRSPHSASDVTPDGQLKPRDDIDYRHLAQAQAASMDFPAPSANGSNSFALDSDGHLVDLSGIKVTVEPSAVTEMPVIQVQAKEAVDDPTRRKNPRGRRLHMPQKTATGRRTAVVDHSYLSAPQPASSSSSMDRPASSSTHSSFIAPASISQPAISVMKEEVPEIGATVEMPVSAPRRQGIVIDHSYLDPTEPVFVISSSSSLASNDQQPPAIAVIEEDAPEVETTPAMLDFSFSNDSRPGPSNLINIDHDALYRQPTGGATLQPYQTGVRNMSTPNSKLLRAVILGADDKQGAVRQLLDGRYLEAIPGLAPADEWACEFCTGQFVSRLGLARHQLRYHYKRDGNALYYCSKCTPARIAYFADKDEFDWHLATYHGVGSNLDGSGVDMGDSNKKQTNAVALRTRKRAALVAQEQLVQMGTEESHDNASVGDQSQSGLPGWTIAVKTEETGDAPVLMEVKEEPGDLD